MDRTTIALYVYGAATLVTLLFLALLTYRLSLIRADPGTLNPKHT
jgi:hypothetical protein